MRLAFVVPRYGREVVGGAETLVREYAEHLGSAGHAVEVHTTCALDHHTWANVLPAGDSRVAGVLVHRHPVTTPRDQRVVASLNARIAAGLSLDAASQRRWVESTGYSEPLLAAVEDAADRVDALLFAPYLFATTCFGAALRPERSLVIPCLHDEAYARFGILQEPLRRAAGLVFNSTAEAALARGLLGSLPAHRVVGPGFDPPGALDPAGARRRTALDGPFVAYAGRREAGKNFPLVAECVTVYDRALSRRGPVALAVMGSGSFSLPASARGIVVDLGFVPQREKLSLFAAAEAVVQLSLNESFSYVVMESWLAGAPVIVHADCAVTRAHCEESGAGVWVRTPEEFAAALDRLRGDPQLRNRLATRGRRHVLAHHTWPVVLRRLENAIVELVA